MFHQKPFKVEINNCNCIFHFYHTTDKIYLIRFKTKHIKLLHLIQSRLEAIIVEKLSETLIRSHVVHLNMLTSILVQGDARLL